MFYPIIITVSAYPRLSIFINFPSLGISHGENQIIVFDLYAFDLYVADKNFFGHNSKVSILYKSKLKFVHDVFDRVPHL